MDEPADLERSRLLLGWLQARRAVDHCLSDLLAAGPAGERRVREQLALVDDLESRAQAAFDRYRMAAVNSGDSASAALSGARRPRLNVVRTADRTGAAEALPATPDAELAGSRSDTNGDHRRHR